ncbi:hypothetical protein DQ238_14980 [Geodermatophilus sp. TF02-6]|nr:hypothetical protein DQ238_14980 [Geodermatophilus sp. TF02-6]
MRSARAKRGVSQAQLAALDGVLRSTVERIEADTRQPSLVTLNRLLAAVDLELRIRLDDLDRLAAAVRELDEGSAARPVRGRGPRRPRPRCSGAGADGHHGGDDEDRRDQRDDPQDQPGDGQPGGGTPPPAGRDTDAAEDHPQQGQHDADRR